MRLISAEEVKKRLPMPEAIKAMRIALGAISSGNGSLPSRTHLDVPAHFGTMLVMPAFVDDQGVESLAVKVATVYEKNSERNLPTVLATILVFDPRTGGLLAAIDGAEVTAIRTAAASAVATDILSRKESCNLGLIGSGVQAKTHLEAIVSVRDIERVSVFSKTKENCQQFVNWSSQKFPGIDFGIVDSADALVSVSDIVCTLTNAREPLFDPAVVRPGTHFNVVGSHQPQAAEVPAKLVAASRVYVDHLETALHESGDLLQPIQMGLMSADDIRGEVGQVLSGMVAGRESNHDMTLFKSVGNAFEDAVAAHFIVHGDEAR